MKKTDKVPDLLPLIIKWERWRIKITQIRMYQTAISTMLKNKAELSDEGRECLGRLVLFRIR